MSRVGQYFIVLDLGRCLGCKSCEIACAIEHSTTRSLYSAIFEYPRPRSRIRVYTIGKFNVPVTCRHCLDAPCVKICPTGAMYRTEEGVVLHNPAKCIGCKFCIAVCPIAHPTVESTGKIVIKCDFCIDRLRKGQQPACVEACPTKAIRLVTSEELAKTRVETYVIALTQPGPPAHEVVRETLITRLLESYRNVTWLE